MELEGYRTIQGYECLSSCIMNFFCYEGYDLRPYDIPMIGNGFGMRYLEVNGIPEIHTDIYESNFCFLDRCGLVYQLGTLDASDAVLFLKQNFAENRRIVLRVNSCGLFYNKAFHGGTVVPHFINLIGISEDGSEIKISDGCAPTYQESVFEDWINTDDLIDVWSDMEFGYLWLDFATDQGICVQQYDRKHLFYQGMKRNALTFGNQLTGRGICAIPRFQKKLECKLKNTEQLPQAEMAYAICNRIRIGGMLSLKKILSFYFMDNVEDAELLNGYKKSVELWDTVSLLFIKFAVSKSERNFVGIQNVFQEIYELECFCSKEILKKGTGKRSGRNAT